LALKDVTRPSFEEENQYENIYAEFLEKSFTPNLSGSTACLTKDQSKP
jgi:hypothetical protein